MIFIKSNLFSQKEISNSSEPKQVLTTKPMAKKGSYQFIVSNTKIKYFFTDETFILIEENRLDSDDVILNLNQFTNVLIPSRKKINMKDYQFLPEYIYE